MAACKHQGVESHLLNLWTSVCVRVCVWVCVCVCVCACVRACVCDMLMTSEHTPELKFSVTLLWCFLCISRSSSDDFFFFNARPFFTSCLHSSPCVCVLICATHTHTSCPHHHACVCVCVLVLCRRRWRVSQQHSDVSVLEFHLERTPLLTSPHPPELTGQSVPPLDFTSSTLSVCYTAR